MLLSSGSVRSLLPFCGPICPQIRSTSTPRSVSQQEWPRRLHFRDSSASQWEAPVRNWRAGTRKKPGYFSVYLSTWDVFSSSCSAIALAFTEQGCLIPDRTGLQEQGLFPLSLQLSHRSGFQPRIIWVSLLNPVCYKFLYYIPSVINAWRGFCFPRQPLTAQVAGHLVCGTLGICRTLIVFACVLIQSPV